MDVQTVRRDFIKSMGLGLGALALSQAAMAQGSEATSAATMFPIACNQYTWQTFYGREGKDFLASLDAGLADVAACGLQGFEPTGESPTQIADMAIRLKKNGLAMKSLYVNSTLHESEEAEKSIATILAIAKEARKGGSEIIVTNPNPLQWGGELSKDDRQLRVQAEALNKLGTALSDLGMTLAYHNHDMELKNGAREFHHMMVGTDPAKVTLCLDTHWIYRGTGNSQVALLDVIKLYGARVSELHLRQSVNGVWSETFGPGDVDYKAVAKALNEFKIQPHIVLEQAVETGTPDTRKSVEAIRQSAENARVLFG